METQDRLNVDRITEGLRTARLGRILRVFESTASTNDIAWSFASNSDHDGMGVFAEHQTAGRGRGHNRWDSQAGQSILGSILLIQRSCHSELLTAATAVAAAQAIEAETRIRPTVKWPNDILLNGKKVCGILIEARKRKNRNDFVVGIGINCRQMKDYFDRATLASPASSLDLETGQVADRNRLASGWLNAMEEILDQTIGDIHGLIDRWKQYSNQLGRHIVLFYRQQKFSGTCVGIDPMYGLILHLDGGGIRMFDAAQTFLVRQADPDIV
jgi:BirA family biotin operon repressor/biotin-[acetyl-CoA-carboxylase] ligase